MTSIVASLTASSGGTSNSTGLAYGIIGHGSEFCSAWAANEIGAQIYTGIGGTYSLLTITWNTNAHTTSFLYSFRNNGATKNQTVTVSTAGSGVVQDATHSDSVAVGDLFDTINDANGGTGSLVGGSGMNFQPSSGTAIHMGMGCTGSSTTNGNFGSLIGNQGNDATRTNVETCVQAAGTLSYLTVATFLNSSNTSPVFTVYKGASAVNSVVTLTAGVAVTSGTDVTHTDSFAAGDLASIKSTGWTSGSVSPTLKMYTYTSTTDGQYWGGGGSGGVAISATTYAPIVGDGVRASKTEASQQYQSGLGFTLKGFWAHCSANSSNNTITQGLNNNGSPGNQAVTWTTTVTGAAQDSTHQDSIGATDLPTRKVSGFGTGSVTLNFHSFEFDVTPISPLFINRVLALQSVNRAGTF